MDSDYGRNRQSLADIEQELYDIFECHPESQLNEEGHPVVPAHALVDVFRVFGERHNGEPLLKADEEKKLGQLVASHPDLDVTPDVLLKFIALLTGDSPQASPAKDLDQGFDRGRTSDKDEDHTYASRSSSHSSGTSHGSRAPPVPPKTPLSVRVPDSPFDSGKRQRTTPLQNAAPSSWAGKRPPPAHRRKSDAGAPGMPKRALSDSESTPSSYSRRGSRSRAPSNPTSPRGYGSPDLSWEASSPPYVGSPPMRPHSRTQSHGQYSTSPPLQSFRYNSRNNNGFDDGGAMHSPGSDHDGSFEFRTRRGHAESLEASLSSLPMPKQHSGSDSDSDSDSDGDNDPTLGLVHDRERSTTSSIASLEPQERLEALQRTNAELGRKLIDAERTLQKKLSEHEAELEEMQLRLEEAKSELSATKREEKELRAKERQNSNQITALESEIAAMQKALDTARSSYQSLQKQYQEQCSESERHRNSLRFRDQELKDHQDQISLHNLELTKWRQAHEQLEAHLATVEAQLTIAREAQVQLEEQKQENLMLKETIDRMRFDMDELRTKAEGAAMSTGGSSAGTSIQGSISKSLGEELMRMNKGRWVGNEEDEGVVEDDDDTPADETEGQDTEGEDVIQTIITRKKKKVASRANRTETIHVEDVKEYADAFTQHYISEFTTSHTTQTDPEPKRRMVSFSSQTDTRALAATSAQTDKQPAPPPRITLEIETQTDIPERSRSATPDTEMTSSSSTILPPTPKPATSPLKGEEPPSYSQVDEEAREMLALRKWHKNLHLPLSPLRGGVSDDAREEWAALKAEIGIECLAIDRVLEMTPRNPDLGDTRHVRKNGRFYNIYNTVVYRNGEDGGLLSTNAIAQVLGLALGISVVGLAVVTQNTAPSYAVPGGPTYYDRAAWSSFNHMSGGEGFAQDGTAAVWDFIGRVGGGAARIARGWPS
ncbi:hypothetical protein BD410DRAFT_813313 [Rickenella mellea]|uniref:Uncharacterized protein n=1 Tax=Rickenella mellea TaxID=50990 RepID=A0A4Y7QDQ8_9AGAM|nr:hypothetical protein BD410DRAFT_813313 [Rickenella mellea]